MNKHDNLRFYQINGGKRKIKQIKNYIEINFKGA